MPADAPEALRAALASRYRFERELGRGGMATVYLVHDLRHDRPLALKLLHPELAAALGRERFVREIHVAARLTHPNIVPLHDSGEADSFLFYVMPYIDGESLRDRLVRDEQLSIEDTLRISRAVAGALAYAHAHNVVHRDIKPANILLCDGEPIVADFGIARAIGRSADDDTLTTAGVTLGTPAYMSPEQATGGHLDGRTDIYALGCVMYEMLAGSPPFTGSSGRTVLARHSVEPVAPIRTVRPAVPVALERVVLKALQKVPADRYATAKDMVAALGALDSHGSSEAVPLPPAPPAATGPWRTGPARGYRFRGAVAVGALATAFLLWLGWEGTRTREDLVAGTAAGMADTSHYLVFPLARDSGVATQFDPARLLRDALGRWSGISVVEFQVPEALARAGRSAAGDASARRVALQSNAGRYIRGDVSLLGDSIDVHAALYDATGSADIALASRTVRLARDLRGADSAFARLADGLLFRTGSPLERARSIGTTSLPARQAYAQGLAALEEWNLARADSQFSAASAHDPRYAQPLLWLALVRSWSGQPVATWRSAAERAAAGRAGLSPRDQAVADAVLASARDDAPVACGAWARLARDAPYDFVAWYGWADCLRRDDVVVPDRRSATGFRFRSSYNQALKSYQRAFQLLPSIHRSFRGGSFGSVRSLLRTSDSELREGRGLAPDTMTFLASPSWEGDSLVLLPVPAAQVFRGKEVRTPRTAEAVHRQREVFHDIASGWVAAFPRSADAMEALAVSLELLGDPAAIDTLRRARSLATGPRERLGVAASEVWMRLKLSAPGDLAGVRAARALADSLLRADSGAGYIEPRLLASLAALTGRSHLAARISRGPAVRRAWGVPPVLASAAPLLVYGAMGGPADSLRVLERSVVTGIARDLSGSARDAARMQWLAYPATLAFPDHRLESVTALSGSGDYLLDAQAALVRGDTTAVRRALARLPAMRLYVRAADVPLDAVYPEAALMAALGDFRGAAAWLDPTLGSLASAAPQIFADATRAGPLVRAMAFRAELAERAGDHARARQWAAVVAALWSDADDFLQPIVRRMGQLAR